MEEHARPANAVWDGRHLSNVNLEVLDRKGTAKKD
jgi:hypothetical protein